MLWVTNIDSDATSLFYCFQYSHTQILYFFMSQEPLYCQQINQSDSIKIYIILLNKNVFRKNYCWYKVTAKGGKTSHS